MDNKEQLFTPIKDWSSYLANSKRYSQQLWSKDEKSNLQKKDFKFLRHIATGGFSNVELVKKDTSSYAIKIMKCSQAPDGRYLQQMSNEVRTLRVTKFPFIIQMVCYFTDPANVYVVMPYIPGGDLWTLLFKRKQLSEDMSRFYSSQILLAVEYLHYLGMVYRDIKTENILIDADGYVKLIDFGFCKQISGMTYTMCGTIQYTAPEVLLNKGHGFAADWWSFGVLLYELVSGQTPFFSRDERAMCEAIVVGKYSANPRFSKGLTEIVDGLLQVDPTMRLGNLNNGVKDVKSHVWFKNVNWLSILNKKVDPPYIPYVPDFEDDGIEPE